MANKQEPQRVDPIYDDMGMTQWYWRVSHQQNFKLGKNTEIGSFTMIDARDRVTIEDDVKVGFACSILSNSTIDDKHGPIILRKGCKLGANSVVMPGITIGEGAVVGSNSFVNRNIPPREMWFGSPVKFYKKLVD